MDIHILVAYASWNGSTAEIAEAIGKELRLVGHMVKVAEVKTISTLEGYRAVIIGGPVYMGNVVSEVGKFVGRHAKDLCKLPIAAFAVGTTPVNGTTDAVANAQKSLRTAIAPLVPVGETIFAGRIDPSKLPFFQRKITEMVKAPSVISGTGMQSRYGPGT